jgi:hypothetical protein
VSVGLKRRVSRLRIERDAVIDFASTSSKKALPAHLDASGGFLNNGRLNRTNLMIREN